MKNADNLVIAGIKAYQLLETVKHQVLLTVFGYHIVCKHRPTCSQFAVSAIRKNGTIIGLWQACKRIVTCW